MAKIIQGKEGGRIIWDKDDWTNGLAPNWGTSVFPSVLGGNQMTTMRAVNPFRKWGVPLPGYSPTVATNSSVVTDYLRKGLVYQTNVDIISNDGKIQQFDGTNTLTNNGTFPHTIVPSGGTTPIGRDCVIYNAKTSGTTAITQNYFYSYSSTTVWNIGCYVNFTTFVDDFASNPTYITTVYIPGNYSAGKDYPHPLIVGDDDLLYVGDRNFLHAIDGTVNSAATKCEFYPEILTLPYGWVITSIEKSDSGLMIFSYFSTVMTDNYRGQTRAWLWNYGELDITRSYNLNDNFTSESFTIGTTIGIFTSGRIVDPQNTSKVSKIQLFDGTKFVPTVAFIGALPIRGGVEVQGDNVTWNSGGTVYSYGSKTLGEKSGLNRIAVMSNGTSSGMLGTFFDSTNVMAVSAGSTTAGGLQMFSTNFESSIGVSDCYLLTGLAEPLFPLYEKGRIKSVTIEFSNSVTPANSTELTVIICDRLNNQQTVISQHTQVTNATEQMIKRENTTANAPLMAFDGLALLLQWTRQSGTATESFGPARVIVDYENYRSVTT